MPKGKAFWITLLFIILVAALGFASKLLPAFESTWVANHLAGLFYVTEITLVLFLVFPDHEAFVLALAAFLLTSVLELLQLWNPEFLAFIRSSFWGQTILGSSFNWYDYPFYLLGSGLGWLLLQLLKRFESK